MHVDNLGADQAVHICCQLWHFFNNREWEKARTLLSDEFEAYWPQSKEKIVGPDNFIEVNRCYPGVHKIQVQNHKVQWDQWEQEFSVSTTVYIESSMPDGKDMKLFAVSFFELNSEGQIKGATEYWADCCDAPEWRKELVERY